MGTRGKVDPRVSYATWLSLIGGNCPLSHRATRENGKIGTRPQADKRGDAHFFFFLLGLSEGERKEELGRGVTKKLRAATNFPKEGGVKKDTGAWRSRGGGADTPAGAKPRLSLTSPSSSLSTDTHSISLPNPVALEPTPRRRGRCLHTAAKTLLLIAQSCTFPKKKITPTNHPQVSHTQGLGPRGCLCWLGIQETTATNGYFVVNHPEVRLAFPMGVLPTVLGQAYSRSTIHASSGSCCRCWL